MPLLFRLPKQVAVDSSGTPHAGAKANFYLTGTTTATDTYTDSALSTPHANPVVADSEGVFEPIWLDPLVDYKLTLNDSADVLIYTVDPIQDDIVSIGYEKLTKSGSYTLVAADADKVLEVTAAATITLPTATDGYRILVANVTAAAIVEVIGAGGDDIKNADTTATDSIFLSSESSALLTSDGTEWIAHKMGASEGTATGSLSGYSAALTPTVMLKRNGSLITLYIETVTTGTSNAATMTLTTYANAANYPNTTILVPCLIVDNGTQAMGLASISNAGTITFGVTPAATGGFTASGTKGLPAGWTLQYDVA